MHVDSSEWETHQVLFGCAEHPDAVICTFLRKVNGSDALADMLHIPGRLEKD